MQPGNANPLRTPFNRMTSFITLGSHDLKVAVSRERLIVLRDLIALRQIGIEIILAGEDRLVVDVQSKRERGARSEFDHATLQHGQRTGQAETRRTSVRVWLVAETSCTAAEDL